MDETLYNNILAALEAVHGGHTANEVRYILSSLFVTLFECGKLVVWGCCFTVNTRETIRLAVCSIHASRAIHLHEA